MRAPRLCLALALLNATASCGREDVELLVYVAALPDAGLATPAREDASDGDANCGRAATFHCLPRGADCATASDCCTGRCDAGVCLDASCGPPGQGCTTRAECCSGVCEGRMATSLERVCAPYCRGDGAPCGAASDCCGRACNQGRCGGSACRKRGDACVTASDCCSGACGVDLRCTVEPQLVCRPVGEDCSSGSAAGCCGQCGAGGACALGPGPCAALGTTCDVGADCCSGTCNLDASGRRLCAGPCASEGADCRFGSDCCSGSCSAVGSRCAKAGATTCSRAGESCSASEACCSGACIGGRCGTCSL